MSEPPLPHLFVYGTLQPGGRWWYVVERHVVASRFATTGGRLFDTGRGYPAAVLARRGDVAERGRVHGAVLELGGDLPAVLADLDAFEGPDYERFVVDTSAGPAWAYSWRAPIDGLVELPDGRYGTSPNP